MNSEIVNWISIIGSFASLIGLAFAYWQIYKTRKAAESAEKASRQTKEAISRNLLIYDISTCIKYIEEIRLYLRNDNYELAQVRSKDLISYIIQNQSLLKSFNQSDKINFEEIVAELNRLRNLLQKKIDKNSQDLILSEPITNWILFPTV